jgi:hypothetical protein
LLEAPGEIAGEARDFHGASRKNLFVREDVQKAHSALHFKHHFF